MPKPRAQRLPRVRELDTASSRLHLLLDWINGVESEPSPTQVRLMLTRFVKSFDGSESVGFVRAYRGEREPWVPAFLFEESRTKSRGATYETRRRDADDPSGEHELWTLRLVLRELLSRGFAASPHASDDDSLTQLHAQPFTPWVQAVPSLRFGVAGGHRKPLATNRQSLKPADIRAYEAPGAFQLLVDGALGDLVPFLVSHLLTLPRMVLLRRCPAPKLKPLDSERCGNFLVSITGPGRPQIVCHPRCGDRYRDAMAPSKSKRTSKGGR